MATKIKEITPDTIRLVRERLELSQTQLAEKIGVGLATVARWENGYFKPSVHVMPKLVEVCKEAGIEVEVA